MRLKPSLIEISQQDPFANDVLDRKPFADALSALVSNVVPPFVTAVLDFLKKQPGGMAYLNTHNGMLLEAFLIAAKQGRTDEDVPEMLEHRRIVSAPHKDDSVNPDRVRAESVIDYYQQMKRQRGQIPALKILRSIVEIGARVA